MKKNFNKCFGFRSYDFDYRLWRWWSFCGKFNKNELNSFVEKGFELIKAKNNNANMDFYSPETLKNFDEKRYKYLKSKDFRLYGSVKGYQYWYLVSIKIRAIKGNFGL